MNTLAQPSVVASAVFLYERSWLKGTITSEFGLQDQIVSPRGYCDIQSLQLGRTNDSKKQVCRMEGGAVLLNSIPKVDLTGPSTFEKRPREGKKHMASGGKNSRWKARLAQRLSGVAARLFGGMWRPHWVGQKVQIVKDLDGQGENFDFCAKSKGLWESSQDNVIWPL